MSQEIFSHRHSSGTPNPQDPRKKPQKQDGDQGDPGILEVKKFVITTKATTLLEWIERWGQANSLWALSFGVSCCAMEYWGSFGAKYDIGQFGLEDLRFSPAQSDLMIVAGTVTQKLAPVLRDMYQEMNSPKWVCAMGACACSGGFYNSYYVLPGVQEILPVDVYIPGCPPSPEAVIQGIQQIQHKISQGPKRAE